MPGPSVRTDIIDVYVFRRQRETTAFLQLRRCVPPLSGTWQPVMGHVEPGETAAAAAVRELREETGFGHDAGLLGLWQLESLNAFFLAQADCVMLSPCFAAEVSPDCEPVLDATHDAARWVAAADADHAFIWPGQRQAIAQIVRDILPPDSPVAAALRL
jgi:8-oxo-dGTP pyrophosphatase MutT (NUDIX family)